MGEAPRMDNGKAVLTVILIAAVANAAAYLFGLYHRFFWYDKALHLYTSFAVTLMLAFLWREQLVRPLKSHRWTLVLALASLGLALGVLWEFAEWMADQLSGQNTIQGKADTIYDLMLDALGAGLAGALAARGSRNSTEAAQSVFVVPANRERKT